MYILDYLVNGQEYFSLMQLRDMKLLLLVFDLTRKHTFYDLPEHLKHLNKETRYDFTSVIIGNKADLEFEREVSYEEGMAFAKTHNAIYIETAAKGSHFNVSTLIPGALALALTKISV